ncbi:MAG: hypothetical protein AB1650_02760 [Candidatus Omnitrophota bacterium]
MKRVAGLLLLTIFTVSGCAMRLADMSVISTRNVSLDKVDLDRMPQVKNVTGKDSKFIFLFIPFGVPHLEDAVDDALRKGQGDLMVDAVVYSRSWWFIIGETGIEVKGSVVKTRGVEE